MTMPSTVKTPQNLAHRATYVDAKTPRGLVAQYAEHGDRSSPVDMRNTTSFTSMGMDNKRFCDDAVTKGKFVFPAGDRSSWPALGHYRPNHQSVQEKRKFADFASRQKHDAIKIERGGKQDGAHWHQDLDSPHHNGFKEYPTDLAGHRGLFDFDSPRPELRKTCLVTMTEAPLYGKEWKDRDSFSTKSTRQPKWDFEQLPERRDPDAAGMVYYQPAMYEVQHDKVMPSPKKSVPMSRHLAFQEVPGQLGHLAPSGNAAGVGSPKSQKKIQGVVPDRSLFRSTTAVLPRVLNVQDYSKLQERDSLFNGGQSWHDLNDPEACDSVLQKELSFDADAAKAPVVSRTDHSIAMSRTTSRAKRSNGVRPLPGDFVMVRECTDWDAKEKPSRFRKDFGTMAFDQTSGRVSAAGGQASPLRRSRSDVAPNFSRSAPTGFTTRARVRP